MAYRTERLVTFGKGGHARALSTMWDGQSLMLGLDDEYAEFIDDLYAVAIGVGIECGLPRDRIRLFESKPHERFPVLVHPTAYVAPGVELGYGAQIMAGAIVQPGCVIGDNVLINTGAQVDHDCVIGDHTIIAPGVVLCGEVKLGRSCVIGVSASIIQRVELPDETRVPGGTLVCGPRDFRKPVRVVRSD